MFETVSHEVVSVSVEVLVLFALTAGSVLLAKVRPAITRFAQKHNLTLIEDAAYKAVLFAEDQLKGEAGLVQRDFAITKAQQILAGKGVKTTEPELLGAIKQGYNLYKSLKPVTFAAATTLAGKEVAPVAAEVGKAAISAAVDKATKEATPVVTAGEVAK